MNNINITHHSMEEWVDKVIPNSMIRRLELLDKSLSMLKMGTLNHKREMGMQWLQNHHKDHPSTTKICLRSTSSHLNSLKCTNSLHRFNISSPLLKWPIIHPCSKDTSLNMGLQWNLHIQLRKYRTNTFRGLP